ncbi:MAG: hypothetical protein Q4F69_00515 [Bacteroidia bacterium]|nr:hypothetical protein [Bacteroidia bacterium]
MNKDVIKSNVPEYIETNLQKTNIMFRIPTKKDVEQRPIRRIIVENAYRRILSDLQGNNYIRNEFLGENVYILFRESYLKASNNAVRNWQTTYAILKIYDVIRYASTDETNFKSKDIKKGSQRKNKYVELIKLKYSFKNESKTYLNFDVEVVIGKKSNGMHVQYSLEYIKNG